MAFTARRGEMGKSDGDAGSYDRAREFTLKKYMEIISDNLTASMGSLVLDIGCGTGKIAKMLGSMGYSVIGIDSSRDMISFASRHSPGRWLAFVLGDAQALPFKDGAFGGAVSTDVIHHVDPAAFSCETSRVMKDSSELISIEPNVSNPRIFLYQKLAPGERIIGTKTLRKVIENDFHVEKTGKAMIIPSNLRGSLPRCARRAEAFLERKSPFDMLSGACFIKAVKAKK
jgi:2-polyprenyl-3-methyl-5-hydroxy-6-metoxy-1,4-benzoquinol methylase